MSQSDGQTSNVSSNVGRANRGAPRQETTLPINQDSAPRGAQEERSSAIALVDERSVRVIEDIDGFVSTWEIMKPAKDKTAKVQINVVKEKAKNAFGPFDKPVKGETTGVVNLINVYEYPDNLEGQEKDLMDKTTLGKVLQSKVPTLCDLLRRGGPQKHEHNYFFSHSMVTCNTTYDPDNSRQQIFVVNATSINRQALGEVWLKIKKPEPPSTEKDDKKREKEDAEIKKRKEDYEKELETRRKEMLEILYERMGRIFFVMEYYGIDHVNIGDFGADFSPRDFEPTPEVPAPSNTGGGVGSSSNTGSSDRSGAQSTKLQVRVFAFATVLATLLRKRFMNSFKTVTIWVSSNESEGTYKRILNKVATLGDAPLVIERRLEVEAKAKSDKKAKEDKEAKEAATLAAETAKNNLETARLKAKGAEDNLANTQAEENRAKFQRDVDVAAAAAAAARSGPGQSFSIQTYYGGQNP